MHLDPNLVPPGSIRVIFRGVHADVVHGEDVASESAATHSNGSAVKRLPFCGVGWGGGGGGGGHRDWEQGQSRLRVQAEGLHGKPRIAWAGGGGARVQKRVRLVPPTSGDGGSPNPNAPFALAPPLQHVNALTGPGGESMSPGALP